MSGPSQIINTIDSKGIGVYQGLPQNKKKMCIKELD